MKKILIFAVFLLQLAYASGQSFSFGNFDFLLSTKVMEDGNISDFGLGYNYSEKFSSRLNFRHTNITKNEELVGVEDSLNAVKETFFEIFFLPIEYNFFKHKSGKAWVGAGLYYEYNKLGEKGFFNMPSLETLVPPKERVNSYSNDFSMHLLGPLIDIGINYKSNYFSIGFSGGIVPIFYLSSKQKTSIVPLIYPHAAENSQNTFGSPHLFLSLDGILFKYINLVLLYNFARLEYGVIDFDDNLSWIITERSIINQSFKLEISALIPIGNEMHFQIGFGYTMDTMHINSSDVISNNRPYLIVTAKKL